jgi:hypothetical protein
VGVIVMFFFLGSVVGMRKRKRRKNVDKNNPRVRGI